MSDKESPVPTGMDLTPLHDDFRQNPYPMLARLRSEDPMHRDEVLHRWFVTDHDLVHQIVRGKSFAVNPKTVGLEVPPPPDWHLELTGGRQPRPSMLSLDDPDHRRLRSLVSQAFTPKSVDAARPRIEAVVDKVLGQVKKKVQAEGEFDAIADFAAPIPTIVIAEILGVDPAFQAEFKEWSDIIVHTFNPLLPEEERKKVIIAGEQLRGYFTGVIAERKKHPGDDLITELVRAEEQGDRLTEEEITTMCNLLIVAGNVTTTDLIGNGLLALLRHPAQLAKLRERPELIGNAVEEMLRYDTPVTMTGRLAGKTQQLGGKTVERRHNLNASLAAANHDPAVYPQPELFDIERKDTHHHSFGGGVHHCLGAPLARAEAQIAISRLLSAFAELSLAEAEVQRKKVPVFQGCARLLVRAA